MAEKCAELDPMRRHAAGILFRLLVVWGPGAAQCLQYAALSRLILIEQALIFFSQS